MGSLHLYFDPVHLDLIQRREILYQSKSLNIKLNISMIKMNITN